MHAHILGFADRYKETHTQTVAEMSVIDWEKDASTVLVRLILK